MKTRQFKERGEVPRQEQDRLQQKLQQQLMQFQLPHEATDPCNNFGVDSGPSFCGVLK